MVFLFLAILWVLLAFQKSSGCVETSSSLDQRTTAGLLCLKWLAYCECLQRFWIWTDTCVSLYRAKKSIWFVLIVHFLLLNTRPSHFAILNIFIRFLSCPSSVCPCTAMLTAVPTQPGVWCHPFIVGKCLDSLTDQKVIDDNNIFRMAYSVSATSNLHLRLTWRSTLPLQMQVWVGDRILWGHLLMLWFKHVGSMHSVSVPSFTIVTSELPQSV